MQAKPRVAALVRKFSPKKDRVGRIRLDLNENVSGLPPEAVKAILAGITPEVLAAYPETTGLYEDLAAFHGVTPAHVMVTSGSELAIRYLFEAFLGPGDQLVVLDPSFAMFDVYARMLEAEVVGVPFGVDFHVPAARVLEAISPRTKVVAIANPNNPTGTVFTERELLEIADRAAAVGAICLVDEAYYYFYPHSVVEHVVSRENLVVTRTFSKACGLASIRLGYAVGSPAVVELAQRVQPIDHINALAVSAGRYLLAHEDLVWSYARLVVDGRRMLVAELEKMGIPTVVGEGNFVLADFGDRRDEIINALKASGVLLGTTLRLPFGSQLVRFTVGPPAVMAQVIEMLRALIK